MAENKFGPAITRAEQDIDKINTKLVSVGETVAKVSAKIRTELGRAFKIQASDELTQLVKGQTQLIGELNKKLKQQTFIIGELKQKKAELNTLIGQENINNKELAKNVDLHAKSVSKLVGTYGNLIAKRKQAKKILHDAITAENKNVVAIKKAQKEYDRLTIKINKANKATSNFSKTGLGGAVRSLKNLASAFGLITGVALFATAIKSAFKLTRTLDSLRFSMNAVITDAVELAQTQTFLKQITQDYGAELVTVTNRYIKFRAAAQQAGLTAQETQNIFSTMTKAAGVLGLKKDELQGIFLALEQMVSKGKVTTEELRRQLGERLPGAMDIMANSLNVTTAKLDEMLKKGQIITAEVLPGFAKEVEKAFGLENINRVETLQAATTRLGNSWTILVEDFNKGNDASGKLMKVLDFLARNLKEIIGLVVASIGVFTAYKALMIAVRIQAALLSGEWFAMRVFMIKLRLETIRTAGAVNLLTKAFKANWILLAATAIIGLVLAFKDWGKSAIETAKALNKVNRGTIDQAKATRELNIEATKLVERYDELKRQTTLSWQEQEELKEVIQAIGKALPQATEEVDKYGRAIGINTIKAKALIESNKELAELTAKITLKDQTASLERMQKQQKSLNDLRENGGTFYLKGLGQLKIVEGELVILSNDKLEGNKALSLEQQRTFILEEQNLKTEIALSKDLIVEAKEILENNDQKNMRLKLQADELERINKAQEKPGSAGEGTIKFLKDKIKLNNKDIELSKDRSKIKQIQKENKGYQKQIDFLLGVEEKRKKGIIAVIGSIKFLEKEIKVLEEKREKLATNSKEYDVYTEAINNSKDALIELRLALGDENFGSSSFLEARISELEKERSKLAVNSAEYDAYTKKIEKLKNEYALLTVRIEKFTKSIDEAASAFGALEISPEFQEFLRKGFGEKQADDAAKKLQKLKDAYKDIFSIATDTFSDMFDFDTSSLDFAFDSLAIKGDRLFSKDKIGEWANFSKEAIGSVLDASMNRYDVELQEAQRSRDIIVNNDLATAKEKRLANQRFEREERRIKTERAKAEKTNNLFKIAIDTASSVVKATQYLSNPITAPLFPGIVAAIIGIGAVQTGLVAAQKIPKFAEGTKAPLGKDTVAMLGDGGKQEYLTKNGRLTGITPDTPTVMNLEKGTEVHKDKMAFLNKYNLDDSIFNMNMASNGRQLDSAMVDMMLYGEVSKMNRAFEKTTEEMKRLADRPINNHNHLYFEGEEREYTM